MHVARQSFKPNALMVIIGSACQNVKAELQLREEAEAKRSGCFQDVVVCSLKWQTALFITCMSLRCALS